MMVATYSGYGVSRYVWANPVYAGYGQQPRHYEHPRRSRVLSGFGLIGTQEEFENELQGIAMWELAPGSHRIRKPGTYCLSTEGVQRLIQAVRDRAAVVGWYVGTPEIVNCEHGTPPGQYVIFDIQVPATPSQPGFTPAELNQTAVPGATMQQAESRGMSTPVLVGIAAGGVLALVVGIAVASKRGK